MIEHTIAAGLNYLDIGILLVLLGFTLNGLYRGMALELGSLLAIILGILAASHFYPESYAYTSKWIGNEMLAGVAAYLGVFIIVAILVNIVAVIIHKVMKVSMIGWIDHLLGLFAGFAKGIIICSLGLVLLNYIMPNNSLVTESRVVPYFEEFMEQVGLKPVQPLLDSLGFK